MASVKRDPEIDKSSPGHHTLEAGSGVMTLEGEHDSFYIVGIGGSAGALEGALQGLR